MPDIFIRYKDRFPRYDREKDAYPASIVLDRNFRSRKTVTESVNFVFTQLMSRACGGIDYIGDEKLAAGAQYPIPPGCAFRLFSLVYYNRLRRKRKVNLQKKSTNLREVYAARSHQAKHPRAKV